MALSDGTYLIGPASGRLMVKTSRTGLGARAGHDLTLDAAGWTGSVVVDMADPARSSVRVDVDADTLEVREATGGVKSLSSSDRAEIKRNIRTKILRTDKHPRITFQSTHVQGSPEAFTVDGELTIVGVTRPVTLRGGIDGYRVQAETTVTQTAWGIKPYSALLGALKLADDVVIQAEAELTPPSL
ncbi:YceI family protein [Phytoactinopolyspora alkaliphila]|uniref:YceI family protein n=1 Tax=Phytoactinopolyspora alkaliphila TaxID=1783498 RepID=UPI001C20BD22